MERTTVDNMLSDYKRCAARRAFLRVRIGMAEEQLRREEEQALAEAAQPGHGLAGGCRGGMPGDPTAGVAVRFAMGHWPRYLQEMAGNLAGMREEMRACEAVCQCVEAWLEALSGRERLVIEQHVIGGAGYGDVLERFAREYPATAVTSRDGLRRIKQRALEKIYAAAGE